MKLYSAVTQNQPHSHSMTVAERVSLSSTRCIVFSSAVSVLNCVSVWVEFAPLLEENQPPPLPLVPSEVAIRRAMLFPAVSEMLWKAEALDTLVVCHTDASKFATAPVLPARLIVCADGKYRGSACRTLGGGRGRVGDHRPPTACCTSKFRNLHIVWYNYGTHYAHFELKHAPLYLFLMSFQQNQARLFVADQRY